MAADDEPARRLRVAIADDALLLREGIESVLSAGGVDVVASVGDGTHALDVIQAGGIDAAVLDIRMPPTFSDEGIAVLEALRASGSTVGVLLLSMYATPEYAIRVLGVGPGVGYLLKERVTERTTLVKAVQTVAAGGTVIDPEVVAQLVARKRIDDPLERLSARERDVLDQMAQGRSNLGIASALYLSPKTVETHVRSIMSKLDIEESPTDHRRILAVLTLLGSR